MQIEVAESIDKQCDRKSNADGVAYCAFNIPKEANSLTVKVSNLSIGSEQAIHNSSQHLVLFLVMCQVLCLSYYMKRKLCVDR